MALSLREKSAISRRIKGNIGIISASGTTLREKAKISREIKADIALLIGLVSTNDENIEHEIAETTAHEVVEQQLFTAARSCRVS